MSEMQTTYHGAFQFFILYSRNIDLVPFIISLHFIVVKMALLHDLPLLLLMSSSVMQHRANLSHLQRRYFGGQISKSKTKQKIYQNSSKQTGQAYHVFEENQHSKHSKFFGK